MHYLYLNFRQQKMAQNPPCIFIIGTKGVELAGVFEPK
jgi:hypothetical protein